MRGKRRHPVIFALSEVVDLNRDMFWRFFGFRAQSGSCWLHLGCEALFAREIFAGAVTGSRALAEAQAAGFGQRSKPRRLDIDLVLRLMLAISIAKNADRNARSRTSQSCFCQSAKRLANE